MKALGDCSYSLHRIDALDLAGTDMLAVMKSRQLNLDQMPKLALGFLSKDIPLTSSLSFQVINPGKQLAEIEVFDYEIWVNDFRLTEGRYDQPLRVAPEDTTYVPVQIETNVYRILANDSLRRQIQDFVLSAQDGREEKARLEIKIKPGIVMGEKTIMAPGFISIKRDLSNRNLFNTGT